MMVLLQCCCGDNKTTKCLSITTRPNWTYTIWMSLPIRQERVSDISVPIETDLKRRQLYCEVEVKHSTNCITETPCH
jgi:hypothetical protein